MWYLLFVLIVTSQSDVLLEDGTRYATVPMPGSTNFHYAPSGDCASSRSSQKVGKIALYKLDLTKTNYEDFVRNIQKNDRPLAVIMTVTLGKAVYAYKITDGKQMTSDLVVPVVSLEPPDFASLDAVLSNADIPCNLSLSKENPYYQVDISPAFNILVSVPTMLAGYGTLLCIFTLCKYRLVRLPFDHRYLAVTFELIANLTRFIYCLDMNSSRRLYHYRFLRLVITLYFPFCISTAFMIVVYAGVIIRSHKKRVKAKAFMQYRGLKIALLCVAALMFVLEIVAQLHYYISLSDALTTVTYFVYLAVFVVVIGLFIAVTVKMLSVFKMSIIQKPKEMEATTRKKATRWLRGFIMKMPLASVGYVLFIIGIILVGVVRNEYNIYGSILSAFGQQVASLALVKSYAARPKKYPFRSSTTANTSSSKTPKTLTMSETNNFSHSGQHPEVDDNESEENDKDTKSHTVDHNMRNYDGERIQMEKEESEDEGFQNAAENSEE